MLWDRHRHVQTCKLAYFLSGIIVAVAGYWWYDTIRSASWYWGDTVLLLAAIAVALSIMLAASKELDDYLEQLQEHH